MLTQSFVSKLLNLKKSSRVVLAFALFSLCASVKVGAIFHRETLKAQYAFDKPVMTLVLSECFNLREDRDYLREDRDLRDLREDRAMIQSPFHPGKRPRREGPPFDDDAGTPLSPMYNPGPPMDNARTLLLRPILRPGPPFDNDSLNL